MNTTTTGNQLMSVSVAAARLAISMRHLYREIAEGNFPRPLKIGRASRVSETDLQAYLAKLEAAREVTPALLQDGR
jgi:excisionase family DNA binding protein